MWEGEERQNTVSIPLMSFQQLRQQNTNRLFRVEVSVKNTSSLLFMSPAAAAKWRLL